MENQDIILPQLDDSFEKFNKEIFDKENIRGKRIVETDNFFLEEDTQSPGYATQVFQNNSYFSILKLYYENLNIEKKGILYNNGSEYGIWFTFDKKGNLIQEVDTDEGYDFSWKEVIQYCDKNKIPLTKGHVTSGFQTTIYKEEREGRKVWEITYQVSGDQLIELILDGKTGKQLASKKIEFINH